ncbi:MAG: PIN domain-containing protein [Actinobacteria bacterium]|nr:PIN domain-containing protein [Actinomycetota bacterium]
MGRYLLDSDAVIDFLGGVPGSVSLLQGLLDQGESLCVCDVVLAEVYSGLDPRVLGKANRLLRAYTFLPTEAGAAEQAGRWRYSFARRGVSLSTTDALIAATAHSHKAAVVTGNVDHYPVDEVDVLPLPRVRR